MMVTADWMAKEHDKIHAKRSWNGFRVALREHILWEERFLFPKLIALGYRREIDGLRGDHDHILDGLSACGSAREEEDLASLIDNHGQEEVAFLRSNRIKVSV